MNGIKWVHNKKVLLFVLVVFLVLCNLGSNYKYIFAKPEEYLVVDGSDGQKKFNDESLQVSVDSSGISWNINYQANDLEWEELENCYLVLYNEKDELIFDNYPGSEINKEGILFEGVSKTGQSGSVTLSGTIENLKESTTYKMELYVESTILKEGQKIEYRKYAAADGVDKISRTTLKKAVEVTDLSIQLDESFQTLTSRDEVSGKYRRESLVDGYFYGSGLFNPMDITDPNVGIIAYMLDVININNMKENYVIDGDIRDESGYWKNIDISQTTDGEHTYSFRFSKFGEIPIKNNALETNIEENSTLYLHPNAEYISKISFRNDLNNKVESNIAIRSFTTKPDISEWYLKQGNIGKELPDYSFATGASTYGCFYPYTMNEDEECVSDKVGAKINGMTVNVFTNENLSEDSFVQTYQLTKSEQAELNVNEYNDKGYKLDIHNLEPGTTYYVQFIVSNGGGKTIINGGEFTTDYAIQVVYVDSNWKEANEGGKVDFSPTIANFATKTNATFQYSADTYTDKLYVPKYYKVNGKDEESEKTALQNLTYKIENVTNPKNVVYVQYLSTLLSVEIPAKIDFIASSSKPLEDNVSSSDSFNYKITNHSELPIKLSFKSLNVKEDESDGIQFVSSFKEQGDQLKLSLMTKNDFTSETREDHKFNETGLFPETAGIGMDANHEYNYEIGCLDGEYETVNIPTLSETVRTWEFKITGSYNGKFYTDSKKPNVSFSFHFDLLLH